MLKSTRYVYVLILSFTVLFLFGCSEEQKQNPSVDTTSQKSITEQKDVSQSQASEQKQSPAVDTTSQKSITEQKDVSQSQASPKQAQLKKAPTELTRQEKQLRFAEHYMASANKGLAPYSQSVAICRDVIKNNPGTDYERRAKEILRQVPEDKRASLKLTDQELGY